jgi:hypothetical protein
MVYDIEQDHGPVHDGVEAAMERGEIQAVQV